MARAKKLFTIGYEQTPQKAVLDELEHAGVKLLVDVRAVTSSRRPGFSKNQLAAGLDERGIAYVHLKGLGTPKEGRPGLPALLRAQPRTLPPPLYRRHHRGARRGEGGKSGSAAGLTTVVIR